MLSVKFFVQRLGRGAIFLGGRHAYTLGGYQGSLFEPMLPVAMEPPPREERPPMTFILVLDKSSSMMHRTGPSPRRITLAQEAAMRAVETLRPDDYLGILTFSGSTTWDVPPRLIGDGLDLREAQDAIGNIFPVGGTRMFTALRTAIEEIHGAQGLQSPHVLLLSDGESSDGSPETFAALAREARELDITISTIAFGEEADANLMELIAKEGGGRFFYVLGTEELPAIMVAESQAARAENTQTGETSLLGGEAIHPILSGFRMNELPTLGGYNALSSRSDEGAEDVLLSANFEDPILSVWHYGLGGVAAWTGDAGEEWASRWLGWPRLGDFWAQVVRYVLPDPGFGNAQVDVVAGSIETVIRVEMRDDRGEPRNFMHLQFRYANKAGDLLALSLPQIGPGLYSQAIPSPAPGAYRGVVVYEDEAGATQIPAPFAVNYPPEWRPVSADASGGFLDALIDSGRVQLMDLDTLRISAEPDQPEFTAALSSEVLLLILMLTWPAEVAIRRRWLPWQIDSKRGGQA
jgi:Mg-chelatase subunit ChlD